MDVGKLCLCHDTPVKQQSDPRQILTKLILVNKRVYRNQEVKVGKNSMQELHKLVIVQMGLGQMVRKIIVDDSGLFVNFHGVSGPSCGPRETE